MFNILHQYLSKDITNVIIWSYIDPIPTANVKLNWDRVIHLLKRRELHRELLSIVI